MSNPFFTVDSILEAAGVPADTPGKLLIAQKIINDGLVQKLAADMAMNSFILEALRAMTGPQRDVLHKRAGVPSKDVLSRRAKWVLSERMDSGRVYLHSKCPSCNQSQDFQQPEPWVENVPIPGATNGESNGVMRTLTKDQVKQLLANIKFSHCGHVDTPPADLWPLIEQVWFAKVTPEKKKPENDKPWWLTNGGK